MVSLLVAAATTSLAIGLAGGVLVGLRIRRWRRRMLFRFLLLARRRLRTRRKNAMALGLATVGLMFAAVGLLALALVVF